MVLNIQSLAIVFALFYTSCSCNGDNVDVIQRMNGGENAAVGEFPYVVALIQTNSYHCSGSLIHVSVVLTAAHCIDNMGLKDFVIAGTTDVLKYQEARSILPNEIDLNGLQPNLQERRVGSLHIHELFKVAKKYNDLDIKNDIGLIFVAKPFDLNEHVNIISLAKEPMAKIRNCTIIGFGLDQNQLKGHLKFAKDVPAKPSALCLPELERNNPKICLDDLSRMPCPGDSGGSLVCGDELRGITSHGTLTNAQRCGYGSQNSFFTDTQYYLPWIKCKKILMGIAVQLSKEEEVYCHKKMFN